jgi:hypothetical protein
MVLIFVIVAVMFLLSFAAFDQLLRIEYEWHRSAWIEDGMPHGLFWVPPEAKMFGGWLVRGSSAFASHRCWLVWLFSRPTWVMEDQSAKKAHIRWRLMVVLANVSFALSILLGLYWR